MVGPSSKERAAAEGGTVPDVLGPGVRLVFCGINPSLYSAATGHHFARPGNRFWKVLHGAGFTDRLLDPSEDGRLGEFGLGITNLVARATATAAELDRTELRAGAARLARLAGELGLDAVVCCGIGAYRTGFCRPAATLGEQQERVGPARCFVVANPSGLQARYQLADLVEQYAVVRRAVGLPDLTRR